ncbi:DUF742 domain-containing protein [Actinoallomurus purpureus]|uniref:DUF742 domain-containing protein n=1 Tax=Actinoallomurus purpureus TaxID=478114 RepID=UPI00355779A4
MNPPKHDRWFDGAAGPVVRPYAVTQGRTGSPGKSFDLLAIVVGSSASEVDRARLEAEHLRLLARCQSPITVADLASGMNLPLGVVHVLLGDLQDRGILSVHAPEEPSQYSHGEEILSRVLAGLHSL